MAYVTYKSGPFILVTLKNGSSNDIGVGEFVKDTGNNTIDVAGDGDTMLGIAHEDIAANETGLVEIPLGAVYAVDAASGVDFNYLDAIYLASKNTVDTGSANDVAAGHVVGKDPASGGRLWAVLVSSLVHKVTHS